MKLHEVIISHPEKVMFPDLNITKAAIAEYYNFIAPYMLPRIKNRPLSLRQYPEGITKLGFFHKHVAKFYPDYIHYGITIKQRHSATSARYSDSRISQE